MQTIRNMLAIWADYIDATVSNKCLRYMLMPYGVLLVILILVATTVLGAWLYLLLALIVASVVIAFFMTIGPRKVQKTSETERFMDEIDDINTIDDTAEFDNVDETKEQLKSLSGASEFSDWYTKRPRVKTRVLAIREDGSPFLIVKIIHTRRAGRMRRRVHYQVETSEIDLNQSSLVDVDLATRIEIKPAPGETDIAVLKRLSWWERGPMQIMIILAWLLMSVSAFYVALRQEDVPDEVILSGFLMVTVVLGVMYFFAWMKWAFKYLLVTNKRVGLIYCPPFSLPGTKPMSPIESIEINEALDQSWFANLLGRLNPAWSYGRLNLDTAAQQDEWMKNIRFVLEHKAVSEAIAAVIAISSAQPSESEAQRISRELADQAHRAMIKHYS